ncbi:hypothetical protein [Flavobacterium gelidilacus]|uniref:hypothetical protein n=1 Tax=Flavobacterium gelidilacus TaxID=206041 RepID=UPI000421A693|nr:hypothetical protein [Flavobacterium gelidilacus]
MLALFSINNVKAGRCTGSSNCKACTTCNYCKHCNDNGGTCGVCDGGDSKTSNSEDNNSSNGFGKMAIVGGGAYLLYRTFRKKK